MVVNCQGFSPFAEQQHQEETDDEQHHHEDGGTDVEPGAETVDEQAVDAGGKAR